VVGKREEDATCGEGLDPHTYAMRGLHHPKKEKINEKRKRAPPEKKFEDKEKRKKKKQCLCHT
jgi:hypothetical protein